LETVTGVESRPAHFALKITVVYVMGTLRTISNLI
jgi:hypothetical protein